MVVKSTTSGPGYKQVALYDSHTDNPVRMAVIDGVIRVPVVFPSTVLNDQWLSIAEGTVTGVSGINKFGRNPGIATTTTREIWDGGTISYIFPTTVDITHMNTTADQAALRGDNVEIQGLDANWDLIIQNATLDAANTATPVVLTTPLRRVFRMRLLSSAVGTTSVRLHNVGDTINYALIEPGNNQTLMAIYTVPNGKTAYMVSLYAALNSSAQVGPTELSVELWERDNDNGYAPFIKHITGLDPDANSTMPPHEFKPYRRIPQKTDVWMSAKPTGKTASVSGGFDLIIVDN